jgi:agmatinase
MRLTQPDDGFAGAPVETDLDRLAADVAIVGIPYGWPYPHPGATAGCALAPTAVRRRAKRLARFRDHWDFDLGGPMLPVEGGPRIVDVGDIPGDATDGPGNAVRTEAAIRSILERGAVPICIGGDDSVPIPILRAFADRGPLTILHVDAHLDFRDEISGVRDGYSSPMRRASEMAHVARIVQVGLRGVGSARAAEIETAIQAGSVIVTARQLRDDGVAAVLERIPSDASMFVAFDTDGLDPSVCPAVSAPAPGGITWDEASDLLGGVGARLVGASFTELVPALDINELSALVVARLMIRLIGGVPRR